MFGPEDEGTTGFINVGHCQSSERIWLFLSRDRRQQTYRFAKTTDNLLSAVKG
jgi:hypothetical protein